MIAVRRGEGPVSPGCGRSARRRSPSRPRRACAGSARVGREQRAVAEHEAATPTIPIQVSVRFTTSIVCGPRRGLRRAPARCRRCRRTTRGARRRARRGGCSTCQPTRIAGSPCEAQPPRHARVSHAHALGIARSTRPITATRGSDEDDAGFHGTPRGCRAGKHGAQDEVEETHACEAYSRAAEPASGSHAALPALARRHRSVRTRSGHAPRAAERPLTVRGRRRSLE